MALSRRTLIALFALLLTPFACAQGGAEADRGRAVEVVALRAPGVDFEGLFIHDGARFVPLVLRPGARSARQALPAGAREIVLAREGVDPATKRPGFVPAARVAWPADAEGQALLLLGARPGSTELLARAFADGPADHPRESIRLVNLSNATLEARVHTFAGRVAGGAITAAIPYPPPDETGPPRTPEYPFALAARSAVDGELVRLSSSTFEAPRGTRTLLIVQAPLEAGSTKVRISAVVDRPPAAPPARR